MSVFSVPVTIGVDEEKIVKEIENNVEAQVVNKITEEVKDIIYKKRSYYDRDEKEPLREMVIEEVRNCIKLNEELIIQEAAKTLVEKMARTKAYKEAVKEADNHNHTCSDCSQFRYDRVNGIYHCSRRAFCNIYQAEEMSACDDFEKGEQNDN